MARIAEIAMPVPVHKGFHYLVPEGLRLEPGMRARAPFGPRSLVGVVTSVFEGEPHMKLKTLYGALDAEPILPRELLDCARWMAKRYSAAVGDCVKALLPSFIKGIEPAPPWPKSVPTAQPPAFTLTPGQEQAVATLTAKLDARAFSAVLLYGVPASGKTEVYLRLIRRAVANGGQALFLVPEISLTQPFFREFTASLDVPVVLWHSKLTPRERRLAWLGIRRGEVKVVVGARSASLLPYRDLRAIMLDEEQDESFKQDEPSPSYHARDVALHRARAHGALCVLGSATPSIEAWAMAKRGEIEFVRMPDRVSSVPPPLVDVMPTPMYGQCISDELVAKIKDRLQKREQVILLVNRRGFATLLMCSKCGWVDRCEDCGVAKIQHEGAAGGWVLRCHHCQRQWPLTEKCGRCGQPALRVSGTGTQKVVSELKRSLPGVRALRMDGDTVSKEKKSDQKLYARFLDREADVLVGTKLVAKSFHFPDVTLVGVVDADTMLHMPDFRSSERTMQLLAQVAGRSGRAGKRGEVLLQTLNPDHAAIAKTVEGNYTAFADGELAARGELGYPPHSELLRLVWAGADETAVARVAHDNAESLRGGPAEGVEIVGPAPCVLKQVRKNWRYHLLIKCSSGAFEKAVAACRALETPSAVKLKLHVDPYDFF